MTMVSFFTFIGLFLAALILILTVPVDAQAYIDPGSGYIFLQVVLAAMIGGFFTFKRFWLELFQKLGLRKSGKDKEEGKQED